jgi:glycosyltransferase involved in cell wall biosynthesis
MHIVIYAGGIPFDGKTIETESLGGSESAAYYVAKELAARGNKVVMFTDCKEGMVSDKVNYIPIGERTQAKPMGTNWHFYCENTPHEINIVQRVPHAFAWPIQSKMNLWWAHDIALKRNSDPIMAQTWQVNRIMPVSNWFKEQIIEAWNPNSEIITPIHNGVDYSLFEQFELKDNSTIENGEINLVYSSRPERGLDNLVAPGGIMEQLLEKAPHIKLTVCGYIHDVPDLDPLYTFLRERIDQLPNCEHIGALTKKDLVKFMCEKADVWCYPTEFEEVSCITAMEAMAAGLTILTTNVGALPETIGGYQNATIFDTSDGIDISKFVERLSSFNNKFRRKPLRSYTWSQTADEIEEIIEDEFSKRKTTDSMARHYLRNSDIIALEKLDGDIPGEVAAQLPYYDFRHNQEDYAKHYADGTEEMYDSDAFTYEAETFIHHPRFLAIAQEVEKLPFGSTIIDYGCAHGQFTNYLGQQYPDHTFIGVDVSPAAVKCANAKRDEMQLVNVNFVEDDWLKFPRSSEGVPAACDLLILGEILEHVPDPGYFMDIVRGVVGEIPVVITTPFGSWEQMSYEREGEKRFHLHHFERSDLVDMFGHHDGFGITCLPAGGSQTGELLGWYVTNFKWLESEATCKPIDYDRKYKESAPRQTVSFCAIVKDGESDIKKVLDSIQPYVDEIVIGVDRNTTDNTFQMISDYAPKNRAPTLPITVFTIDSPLDIGFDAARNLTLERASKDWILWCDADEELICGERLPKFLRNNGWDGYGIPQHHFAVEPLGVLSTDYPVRLFRNTPAVEFVGVVHEHPTLKADINEGVGHAWVVHELHFSHIGYTTEVIRRNRFKRNIDLMARDREKWPDRILGKFLWVRDLSLMCRFDLEANGGQVSPEMRQRALMGIDLWEKTMDEHADHPQAVRMIKDHLEFYNTLTNILDQGFEFKIKLASGLNGSTPQLEQMPELSARFLNKRHLDKFLSIVIDSEVKSYEEKYL